MKKSEIFERIINIVCDICEVHRENILNGCKLQNVVDARVMLIRELKRFGFSTHDIAVVSLRIVKGNMVYNADYMPPMEDIKSKSRSIDRQYSSYDDMVAQSKIFSHLAKEVSTAVHESDILHLRHEIVTTSTFLTT